MAIINKKLIHFNNKSQFNEAYVASDAGNTKWVYKGTTYASVPANSNGIKYQSIVYIKDTQEVWTHGQMYRGVDYIKKLTQSEYDSLSSKNASTLYIVK